MSIFFSIDAPAPICFFIINDLKTLVFGASPMPVNLLNRSKLIFDAAGIGASYIPGHGHADTLSLELSIGKERVIVNSGISEYAETKMRLLQRKTRSHSTIEVNGEDSSQVWNSFRVGNRAKVVKRDCFLDSNDTIVMNATHNGYKKWLGGCLHSRKINFGKSYLSISDYIHGSYKSAISRIYFHPLLKLKITFDDKF